ncbi:hypothetical protein Y032_0063g3444 [Ancylostoma ceylanicum]|uniref:Peptidase M13 C-terminal domain-containing protein n=1 Tax=Ancylostoma ceylanicum TaxID=53326 RepID=A0A016U0V2_9BILA|nr:hypothetical protein Y032_0063g3444 [Ancylostoma ceylanicum]
MPIACVSRASNARIHFFIRTFHEDQSTLHFTRNKNESAANGSGLHLGLNASLKLSRNWCSVVRPKHYVQIIMTDVHAPSKYRATIPLRNRIEFANAFNCARGTPMNPENKCQVW